MRYTIIGCPGDPIAKHSFTPSDRLCYLNQLVLCLVSVYHLCVYQKATLCYDFSFHHLPLSSMDTEHLGVLSSSAGEQTIVGQ